VLVPKKQNPSRVADYRPISLTHCFAKILSKLLANRLAKGLDDLTAVNQTTFIKKGCIHDNLSVQQVVRSSKKKIPNIFIKLDISKAFDSVNWPYIVEIKSHLGFGERWINWISVLWCTASSCLLLNGELDKRILHYRG
jgi:hypothetical protein